MQGPYLLLQTLIGPIQPSVLRLRSRALVNVKMPAVGLRDLKAKPSVVHRASTWMIPSGPVRADGHDVICHV